MKRGTSPTGFAYKLLKDKKKHLIQISLKRTRIVTKK